MALKPTIYKFKIALTDLNRDYYDSLNLTVAKHPSETLERMMARMLVFCINAQENLSFAKGLNVAEEPDIWAHTLDNQILLWVDVGEPAFDRIKKASRIATMVKVYSFNTKSDVWWKQEQAKFSDLAVSVFRLQWENIQSLGLLVQRTMDLSVTVTENSAYIATELGECEVSWSVLQIS